MLTTEPCGGCTARGPNTKVLSYSLYSQALILTPLILICILRYFFIYCWFFKFLLHLWFGFVYSMIICEQHTVKRVLKSLCFIYSSTEPNTLYTGK